MMKAYFYAYAGFLAVLAISGFAAAQTDGQAGDSLEVAQAKQAGMKAVGAGLAVGLAGLGAGIGEQSIGAAAIGAMAEDPKLFGRGLLMTVIPETIVIFGLVVALIILFI
jgi:V/A-type H+/Na+-transporting ATPase subunit K